MSTPPVNSPYNTSNTVGLIEQKAKRKLMETSPENPVIVGNMPTMELMKMMQDSMSKLLDEKLENLPTKSDITDLKNNIEGVKDDIKRLKIENEELKAEVQKLREDKEEDKKRLQKLEDQLGRNKLIVRGLPYQKSLHGAVKKLFNGNLKMSIEPEIDFIKKVQETNEKMTVLVEFKSTKTVADVLRNTKMLAGTSIFIERDLSGVRLQRKKIMLLLKKELQKHNGEKRIGVRGEQLVLDGRSFYWNNKNELMSGQNNGMKILQSIIGNSIENIDLSYEHFVEILSSKNY